MKYFTSVAIIFLLSFLKPQNRIGEWSSYTCPLDIRDLIVDDYAIYCATGGGLLKYSNDNFDIYTTTDGLIGVDISKIAFDTIETASLFSILTLSKYSPASTITR